LLSVLHDKLVDLKKENQGLSNADHNADEFYHKLESINPRVMNKLTLCFNPDKMILPEATSYSAGLTNSMLEDQAKFDSDTVSLLNAWLKRLPAPVCLVAHNGDKFDFDLLRKEIREAGAGPSLNKENFFCADTLVGIRNISNGGKIEQWELSHSEADVKKKRKGTPENFKLQTLHKFLFGFEPSSSHSSEADCLSLMRITAALGKDWTDWAKHNAKLLLVYS